jgi:hypothetical protein
MTHHHHAEQMTGADAGPVNIQAPTPPIDRLPGDIRNLLDLVDTALDKTRAAGVLHGAGIEDSLARTVAELAGGITAALNTARRAHRDHLDHEARFAGYVDQAARDYAALEHAYERLSDRHLADPNADSVRALLDTLNAIKRLEGGLTEDVAREAIALAHGGLVAWHDRAGVADRYDRNLPAPDANELAALEELEVLEPLRRGDLAEVVGDALANLSPRYLRRANPAPAPSPELPLETVEDLEFADEHVGLSRLMCQRPECGRPISEHSVYHHEPDDGAPHGPEGRFAVDTHGLYCPTPTE